MITIIAVFCGFLLDILFGDPSWIPHPVTWMGKYISWLEPKLRRACANTLKGQRRAGRWLVFIVIFTVAVITVGLSIGAYYLHPLVYLFLNMLWCWQALAYHGLKETAQRVMFHLQDGDLNAARKAVHELVGRDVEALDEEGVTKAAVESVAENSNDGIIAPLFYMLIGGGALAMIYKSVNTMDSMVGYKNREYINFGRAAAKTDDVVGWLPARISALLLRTGAGLTNNCSARDARHIYRRDRKKTSSPNAGQTESVAAGALGIQLGGPAYYFGEFVDKPYLGDDLREAVPEDIALTNKMVSKGTWLGVIIGLLLRLLVVVLVTL